MEILLKIQSKLFKIKYEPLKIIKIQVILFGIDAFFLPLSQSITFDCLLDCAPFYSNLHQLHTTAKGQLISKVPFGNLNSSKKRTKIFQKVCPSY